MMKRIKTMVAGLVVALALATPVLATQSSYALFDNAKAEACNGINLGASASCANGATGLQSVLKNVLDILTIVVGLIAVVMVIVGGLKFITSAGDAAKAASGRSTLTYAVIGLVIAALAQVIVQFVISKT